MDQKQSLLEFGRDKISNISQLGGIELSMLTDGHSNGTRIAWFNTGSGLRFKVVIDRGLDIADAFYNQNSLAWISHLGVAPANLYSHSDLDWLYSLGGGLLTTCGLHHIGPAQNESTGEYPLHDRIGALPASVESIIQPDLNRGNYQMSISGRTLQTTAMGHHMEIKRKISTILGSSRIVIEDCVTNLGNRPAPHMLLYHFNFGYPLIDEDTSICWDGKWRSRGSDADNFIFNNDNDPQFKRCLSPIEQHNGSDESVAFIDPDQNLDGMCECGVNNKMLGIEVKMRFLKSQLPCLTNWLHFGKNEYMVGVEPGTNHPVGSAQAVKDSTMIYINPGESRSYRIELEIINQNSF